MPFVRLRSSSALGGVANVKSNSDGEVLLSGADVTALFATSGALYDFNSQALLSGSDASALINTSGSLYDVNQGALLSGTNSASVAWT